MSERQSPGETPRARRDTGPTEFVEQDKALEQLARGPTDDLLHLRRANTIGDYQREVDVHRGHRGNRLVHTCGGRDGSTGLTRPSFRYSLCGPITFTWLCRIHPAGQRRKRLKVDFNSE